MGYTQYWKILKPLDKAFAEFSEDSALIIKTAMDAGIELGDGLGQNLPVTTDVLISFNGVGEGEHESFHITAIDTGFNFCKTAEKPYDAVVCAILIRAKFYFGDAIEIKSDGAWKDWQGGQLLYENVFDMEPQSIFA